MWAGQRYDVTASFKLSWDWLNGVLWWLTPPVMFLHTWLECSDNTEPPCRIGLCLYSVAAVVLIVILRRYILLFLSNKMSFCPQGCFLGQWSQLQQRQQGEEQKGLCVFKSPFHYAAKQKAPWDELRQGLKSKNSLKASRKDQAAAARMT